MASIRISMTLRAGQTLAAYLQRGRDNGDFLFGWFRNGQEVTDGSLHLLMSDLLDRLWDAIETAEATNVHQE